MSFLLDPPLLFASGTLVGLFEDDPADRRRLTAGVLAAFYAVSGLLYLDVLPWWNGERWTRGSTFMLNSGLGTRLRRTAGVDVLAIVLFAAYPLWVWVGLRTGRTVAGAVPGLRSGEPGADGAADATASVDGDGAGGDGS